MKDTRYYDKAHIEEAMAKGVYSRKRGMELLDKIHNQTKDIDLEDKRKKFIKDQKRYDQHYKDVRNDPTKLQNEEVKAYIKFFEQNPNEF